MTRPRVHKQFLNKLHSILPQGCRPCILSDAGFKNPWFEAVSALGWHYKHRRVLSFFYLGCQVIRKKIHTPIDILYSSLDSNRSFNGFGRGARSLCVMQRSFLCQSMPK